MHPAPFHRRRFALITSVLLVALAFRALVPDGYMPAAGRPLSVEICPAGFPMQLLMHAGHEHSGHHHHFDSCVFGSAPGAGPAPHIVQAVSLRPTVSEPTRPSEPLQISTRLPRAQQARAPPPSA